MAAQREPRETFHVFVQTAAGGNFIVSALKGRDDVQVVEIDNQTGSLHYTAHRGVDLFDSVDAALSSLGDGDRDSLRTTVFACALLGYLHVGSIGLVVMATKVRSDLSLPGDRPVRTVLETQWIKIRLNYPYGNNRAEERSIEVLRDSTIGALHIYCESHDITRPFPSAHAVTDHDPEFCWNDFLAESYAQLNMREWCVVLVQGFAFGRQLDPLPRLQLSVGFLARKSVGNPNTASYGCGLNDAARPGNEFECEQLVWSRSPSTTFPSYAWTSHVFRCGSAPVRWSARLALVDAASAAAHVLEQALPDGLQSPAPPQASPGSSSSATWDAHAEYDVPGPSGAPPAGTAQYIELLAGRFCQGPVVCVDPLDHSSANELALSQALAKTVQGVESLLASPLEYVHVDRESVCDKNVIERGVPLLWKTVAPHVRQLTVSSGRMTSRLSGASDDPSVSATPPGFTRVASAGSLSVSPLASPRMLTDIGASSLLHNQGGRGSHIHMQSGVLRYCCGHSLRQAVLPAFFVSLRVLYRQIEILSRADPETDVALSIWASQDLTLEMVTGGVSAVVSEWLAECFVCLHDVSSVLFTGAPKTLHPVLHDFFRSRSAGTHAMALNRMFAGIHFHERARQAQMHMLLGVHRETYFPSLSILPHRLVSMYSAWCLETSGDGRLVQGSGGASALLSDPKVAYVCESYPDFSLTIYLSQPCIVTEIALTMRQVDGARPPDFVGVHLGLYLTDLHVAIQQVRLPRCADGTVLYFPVHTRSGSSKARAPIRSLGERFPFSTPDRSRLTRIVQLVFRASPADQEARSPYSGRGSVGSSGDGSAGPRIVLGRLQIFGTVPMAESSPELHRLGLIRAQTSKKAQAILHEIAVDASAQDDEYGPLSSDDEDDEDDAADDGDGEGNGKGAGDDRPKMSPSVYQDREKRQRVLVDKYVGAVWQRLRLISPASMGSGGTPKLSLKDLLDLEVMRLRLGLTCTERNDVLHALGVDLDLLDPNIFVRPVDDKMVQGMIRAARHKDRSCSGSECKTMLGFSNKFVCHSCFQRFCSSCMAPQGVRILEFRVQRAFAVCRRCFGLNSEMQQTVNEIERLHERQQMLQDMDNNSKEQTLIKIQQGHTPWRDQTSSGLSLAEFPAAGILERVPTALHSERIECILFPPYVTEGWWCAPRKTRRAVITVVLSVPGIVESLEVVAGPDGYTARNQIEITILSTVKLADMRSVGKWTVPQCGPCEAVRYRFDAPFHCRALRFEMELKGGGGGQGEAGRLHLGRLRVWGKPQVVAWSDLCLRHQPSASSQGRDAAADARETVTIKSQQLRFEGRVVDVAFELATIRGLGLVVRHGEEGSPSQISRLRVYIMTLAKGELVTQHRMGTFFVPKCKPHTHLWYDFPAPCAGNLLVVEVLANYGGREMCLPKFVVVRRR